MCSVFSHSITNSLSKCVGVTHTMPNKALKMSLESACLICLNQLLILRYTPKAMLTLEMGAK